MAAPPSPRPPKAQSVDSEAPLSLFIDTDLGTRLAMVAAPDTTIRRLKSHVAAEHVAAFPDIGPVDVKSFQVHRKGALYHLSESMTVKSAFTRVKGSFFLHVKMVERRCCQGAPEIDGRGTSAGQVGIHLENHDRKLPAAIPEVLDDVLLPPSAQLDAEIKNASEGLAIDADNNKSAKQTNTSHVVEVDAKEYFLQGSRDHEVDGNVSDNKKFMIEESMLGQMHAMNDIFRGKNHKKAKRTDSVHVSATDPRITDESDTMDIDTSLGKAVNDNIPEGSLRKENPGTVSKKKKRRIHQLASSETVSGEETTDLPTGAMGLSKSVADASEVELTNRDGSKARSTVLLLSSEHNDENQGGKHVEFVNNAQASTDLTSEQGNIDHVHNDDKNSSIGDAINSTAEVPASGEKFVGGSNGPWNGEEKHEEIKHHKYNEDGHGGIAETGNMEKDGKNTDIMENRPTTDNIPKEKKRKKVKKVSSVDMTSMDTAGNKQILGHTENAGKSDKAYTEREVLHSPYMEPVSDNVQQGGSAVIGSPNGDGKRKKKRRRQSESSNGAELNQDQIKSAEHVSNVISIQDTNSAPLDAQQMTQGNVEGAAASDQKFGGSLDIAAANMIDEVLADLKSRDSLSEDLCENMLTGQIHRDSNPNSLEHPAPADIKVGNYAALPPKYPEDIHSNVPASSSPSHKKPKGKQLKVKLTDSSHHSGGMLEGDANTEQKESDTLRFSGKESGLKDGLTGDVRVQDVSKDKSTKRKKKVKGTSDTGKLAQPSSDEQVNQVPRVDMVGVNASIQEDLAQGGSMIDTLMETVTDVQLKGKRASKTRASKIQGTITHRLKDCQDGNATGITGTHDNENASGYPTESSVVQKDAATLEFSSPNAQKEKEKPLRTELQSQDSAMEHDPNADLVHCSAGKGFVSPKSSDAVEPNHCTLAHPASDKINFIDHFSLGKINDELVSAESIQNNEDETLEAKNKKNNTHKTGPNDLESPAEKTSLMDHLSTSEVVAPPAKAENMSREYDNVKSDKVKRKKKRKTNSEGPAADKENFDDDHQGTGIGTQDSLNSSVQKGRMGQCNGNKNNRAIQNVSPQQQEPEDVIFDRIVEKKLHQGDVDSQNNLPITKDNANVSKELQKSTSQKKPRAKSSKPDVSNIVKSFSMHSAASSDSAGGTPQIANRYRLAVRKVSRKKYEQDNTKSKKESRKVGSGAIFSNAISEESDDAIDTKGEKAAFEASSDNSSTYADSGISSAPYEESDVDDGALSLSQKSLKGVHIGSILRGSRSYKKAKQKQAELLDDDTEVPDSQPADDLWG